MAIDGITNGTKNVAIVTIVVVKAFFGNRNYQLFLKCCGCIFFISENFMYFCDKFLFFVDTFC